MHTRDFLIGGDSLLGEQGGNTENLNFPQGGLLRNGFHFHSEKLLIFLIFGVAAAPDVAGALCAPAFAPALAAAGKSRQ